MSEQAARCICRVTQCKRRHGLTLIPKIAPVLTAVALALATPLVAQDSAPAEITADSITDTQIEAFANAVMAVQAVSEEYMPRIQQEQDQEQREEIIAEAEAAALSAIDEVENMTAEEYRAIGGIAQNDEELNQRIIARLEEMQAEGEGE